MRKHQVSRQSRGHLVPGSMANVMLRIQGHKLRNQRATELAFEKMGSNQPRQRMGTSSEVS
jgi:hypothetical protein